MSKDFEELFACLRHRNVKALIVGGYAVAFHGQPRFTKDIDVFVEAPEPHPHLAAEPCPSNGEGRQRSGEPGAEARSDNAGSVNHLSLVPPIRPAEHPTQFAPISRKDPPRSSRH
jgi:hypothetical protein